MFEVIQLKKKGKPDTFDPAGRRPAFPLRIVLYFFNFREKWLMLVLAIKKLATVLCCIRYKKKKHGKMYAFIK